MNWKRIDLDDNVGGSAALLVRAYGLEGAKFPRIVLSIYFYDAGDRVITEASKVNTRSGIRFSVTKKDVAGDWWHDCALPEGLIDEFRNMLRQANCSHCVEGVPLHENGVCHVHKGTDGFHREGHISACWGADDYDAKEKP